MDYIVNNRAVVDTAAILLSIFLGIGCVIATALYMDYWQAKEQYKKRIGKTNEYNSTD
jgi:hypothetical protein